MTVRLRPPSSTIYDLPLDVLPLLFVQLHPVELLMAERVCKIWKNVSLSQNETWKHVAYQKGIFVDESLPIRFQVLESFRPYCEAARKVFSEELQTIPTNLSPSIEKQMIDKRIAKIDQALMDPLKALSDSLKMDGIPYKPFETGSALIHDCIKMIPVWVETGKLNINEDLFHYLMGEEGHLKDFKKGLPSIRSFVDDCIAARLIDGSQQPSLQVPLMISHISVMQKAIFSLAEYILHFTAKPSLTIVADLCFESAGVQLRKAWHPISLIRHEKKDIITPLLENLKDDHWNHAFEQFMLNEGISVNVEIQYPPFIQKILKKMDRSEVQDLIDRIPSPPVNTDNVYIHYMNKQRLKDLQRSFSELTL